MVLHAWLQVNEAFADSCKVFGPVISATVRVKPGINKSWALCTFKEPAGARKAVSDGMTVVDGDGNPVVLKVKVRINRKLYLLLQPTVLSCAHAFVPPFPSSYACVACPDCRKISDVETNLKKGSTGALAGMAKKHDEEVEAAKALMAKMWSKVRHLNFPSTRLRLPRRPSPPPSQK
eukprot:SAG11_NODE_17_length_26125_cov_45.892723_1_plen_177_part_00